MCLYTNFDQELKIAEKPIKCHKVVIPRYQGWIPIIYSKYTLKYNTILQPLDEDNNSVRNLKVGTWDEPLCGKYLKIEVGFHAFTKKEHAIKCSERVNGSKHKVAVIPKGAEYMEGFDGEIVASRMAVFTNILRYWLWRLFR